MKKKETKIISVITEKGGVGKTTTTFNLGCALGAMGLKVLLIDFDKQANLSSSCGFISDGHRTVSDLIYNAATGYPSEYTNVVRTSANNKNVYYIPASHMLDASNSIIASCPDCNFVIKKILEDSFFNQYDYIIIDNRPALDLLAQNALNAAHYAIVPVDGGVHSFDAIDSILAKLKTISNTTNPKLKLIGILENKTDNTNICKQIDIACRELYGENVLKTRIPDRKAQVNNSITSCTGCVNIKTNTLAEVYHSLAEEIVERSMEHNG